ncbi:MAG: beta-lactamase domain-containing [Geobacteraceae bacterium]|nr:MAG: beta-lactamase domain-containing [Geobacteraceae bacterium]
MRLRVLGCSGAELPGHHTSAFLIDDSLLLDAGTIGAVLNETEQSLLQYIFVTHTHLDHIKGIPLLADTVNFNKIDHTIRIVSIKENLQTIRRHLLNNIIWPDFTVIPSPDSPVLACTEIRTDREHTFGAYSVTAIRVDHSVPAVGFVVRRGDKGILYTGDTGPTTGIWEQAGKLSAMIIEVSFPNRMEEFALQTGHLTPRLFAKQIGKMRKLPPRILISHTKPQFFESINTEVRELGIEGVEFLREGNIYDL